MRPLKIVLFQKRAGADVEANLVRIEARLSKVPACDLIALPEVFAIRGNDTDYRAAAERLPGPITKHLMALAARAQLDRHEEDSGAFKNGTPEVTLIWNERRVTSTAFLRDYETFLETWATDYQEVNHANITPAEIAAFFDPHPVQAETFPNQQVFDYAGLEGRLMSCSYAPAEDDPRHGPMLAALHALFERHAQDGKVCFE